MVRRSLCSWWWGLTNPSPDTKSTRPWRAVAARRTRGGACKSVRGDHEILIWWARAPRAVPAKPAWADGGNYSCERVVVTAATETTHASRLPRLGDGNYLYESNSWVWGRKIVVRVAACSGKRYGRPWAPDTLAHDRN
jgi:hypothetical protein